MNKTTQWIIWVLALIAINIPVVSLASFSLFATAGDVGFLSVDYLIAPAILLTGNIVIIQLFIAIRRNYIKGFIYGLIVATVEAIGFYWFAVSFTAPVLVIPGVSILTAIVLLIYQVNMRKRIE